MTFVHGIAGAEELWKEHARRDGAGVGAHHAPKMSVDASAPPSMASPAIADAATS
jgi:hypothetical protein